MTDFPRFIDFEKEVIFRQRKPQSKTTEVINWLSDILILANSSVKVNTHKIDFTTMPDNKYKTTEQDTGQKWIDGRPIYRKVVRGTVNMTGGFNTSNLPHGIQGLTSAWEIIRYYGNMRLSGSLNNNPIKQALPYIEGTHQSGVTSIDQTNITISGSYAWRNSEVSIVLEYVK